MGLNRYAKRRDENEAQIVAALNKIGVQTWALDAPLDLLCLKQKRFFLVECKSEGGRLTCSQRQFLQDTHGAPRFVVETVEQAIDAADSVCGEMP